MLSALPAPPDEAELRRWAAAFGSMGAVLDAVDDETLGMGLRRLGVTVIGAEAHARLVYPPGVAALVPAPASVKIPRARTR